MANREGTGRNRWEAGWAGKCKQLVKIPAFCIFSSPYWLFYCPAFWVDIHFLQILFFITRYVKFQGPASSASFQMTLTRLLDIFWNQGQISILNISVAQNNFCLIFIAHIYQTPHVTAFSSYPCYSMHISEMLHLPSAENLDLPSFSLTVAKFLLRLFQPIS